jgi:hypothetical protein
MAIVDHNIGSLSLIVDHIDAFQAVPIDFLPECRAAHDTVAKHPELEERQRNSLREEYFADLSRDAGERVADDPDDYILEKSSLLHEWRALLSRSEAFTHELIRHLDYLTRISIGPHTIDRPTRTYPERAGL